MPTGLPPILPPTTRLLILGSLPGASSLAAARYYAHPRNRFWQLVGEVLDTELEALPYGTRLDRLAEAGIGLWDVIASAHRPGSLDAHIRGAAANDLAGLVGSLPELGAVAFNGAKAFALGSRQLAGTGIPLILLPSSSPANANMPLAAKLERWLTLRTVLAGPRG